MKKIFMKLLVLNVLTLMLGSRQMFAQDGTFPVILDEIVNGSVMLDPALPADGKYKAGTVVTVTATPAAGYILDAGYYSVLGRFGQMATGVTTSPFKVTIDQEKHIGASFIAKSEVDHVNVISDVVYAKPGVKTLKYDVYSPKGAKNLPIIVIIHGGGWSSNNEDIMRGMAREMTKNGKYVVISVDYRWAQKLDGDATNNTMANLIEDVYGAIAHIMEHAAEYGGDASRIALTGDSAGGHLSAFCADAPNKIGKGGFGKTPGVFEFMPSYIPKNKTVEQLRTEMMAAIKAAAPSYGVFGGNLLNHYSDDPKADSTWKNAIAPLNNIPDAKEREVPQYLTRGTNDMLIRDETVKVYVDALVKAGQRVEYVQVGGANHAFFDWKPDARTKATFYKYGVYYVHEMENFFNSIFYPVKMPM
jgi:acetyl esterase/lipase